MARLVPFQQQLPAACSAAHDKLCLRVWKVLIKCSVLSGQVEPIPAAAAALDAAQEHAREAGSSLGSDAEEAASCEARPARSCRHGKKVKDARQVDVALIDTIIRLAPPDLL